METTNILVDGSSVFEIENKKELIIELSTLFSFNNSDIDDESIIWGPERILYGALR